MTITLKRIAGLVFFLSVLFAGATFTHAQEATLIQDKITTYKARVTEVVIEETKIIPGTNKQAVHQTIKADILSGDNEGKNVVVNNDYTPLKKGDVFYVNHTVHSDGGEFYNMSEPYRLTPLIVLLALFILLVVAFGGIQGVRGLVSLAGSLLLILYVLLPGIFHGMSPLMLSIGVSALIILVGSYVTHGFNKTTTSAVLGMILTVVVTGVLAYIAVHWAKLTGFDSEEAVYLNLNSKGSIDFLGLLMGGIMIGLLGVLYDVAISQAISVEELHRVGKTLPRTYIYKRALRIGREHIGALVNTLAIAYVGASLPLLLLFYSSEYPTLQIMNKEIFAVEIIRTLVGSIGIVIAVPITTFIAVFMLIPRNHGEQKVSDAEREAVEHFHHKH